jgi:uncharacterized protein (DUF2237 family)
MDPSASLLTLENVDLRTDPLARRYFKDETVTVEFAAGSGMLMSRVGPNHHAAGDALVAGADGDRWCVSRARFDARYVPVPPLAHGDAGQYRNRTQPVLARQMTTAFRCQRTAGGDWLQGEAGDWLLQYAPGDYGVASAARFALVYRATP